MIDKSINMFGTETCTGLGSSSVKTFSSVEKKASNKSQIKDGIKMEGRLSVFYYKLQAHCLRTAFCLMAILVILNLFGTFHLNGIQVKT
jgi:hypothetical protein